MRSLLAILWVVSVTLGLGIIVNWTPDGTSQRLLHYCINGGFDTIVIRSIHFSPEVVKSNFIDFCEANGEKATLQTCPQIGADIIACQGAGKKVLVQLNPDSHLPDDIEAAAQFARTLWNEFGPRVRGASINANARVFGDAAIDGFTFAWEMLQKPRYITLARQLRKINPWVTIAAEADCFGDLVPVLLEGPIDYGIIRFWEGRCGIDKEFGWEVWSNYAKTIQQRDPSFKMFIEMSGRSGKKTIETIAQKLGHLANDPALGGFAIADVSDAEKNDDLGARLKILLLEKLFGAALAAREASLLSSRNKAVLYWNPNKSVERLLHYCEYTDVDYIVIQVVHFWPVNFKTRFIEHCVKYISTSNIQTCPNIANDITWCQTLGKKVLLNLDPDTWVQDDKSAEDLANLFWESFGIPTNAAVSRPFGEAVVDGFTFKSTMTKTSPFSTLGKHLKYLHPSMTLAIENECSSEDVRVLYDVPFDFGIVNFSEGMCSVNEGFDWQTWRHHALKVRKNNPRFTMLVKIPKLVDNTPVLNKLVALDSDPAFGGLAVDEISSEGDRKTLTSLIYAPLHALKFYFPLKSTVETSKGPRRTSIILYWDPNTASHRLYHYCKTYNAATMVIRSVFISPNRIRTGFTQFCEEGFAKGSSVQNCPIISEDIQRCQAQGTKVIVRLVPDIDFIADQSGTDFASILLASFGTLVNRAISRPFGNATVDGFTFEWTMLGRTPYVVLAELLKKIDSNLVVGAESDCSDELVPAQFLKPFDFALVNFGSWNCGISADFNWHKWSQFFSIVRRVVPNFEAFVAVRGTSGPAVFSMFESKLPILLRDSIFGGFAVNDASNGENNYDVVLRLQEYLTKISTSRGGLVLVAQVEVD